MSSSELDIYKKNRIIDLQKNYNTNGLRLYSILLANANSIKSARFTSQNVKNININKLITQYNANINALKNSLTKSIINIQNFTPKLITNNKGKKALLIGINYTGTQNELRGCINDVNCIKDRITKEGFTYANINI